MGVVSSFIIVPAPALSLASLVASSSTTGFALLAELMSALAVASCKDLFFAFSALLGEPSGEIFVVLVLSRHLSFFRLFGLVVALSARVLPVRRGVGVALDGLGVMPLIVAVAIEHASVAIVAETIEEEAVGRDEGAIGEVEESVFVEVAALGQGVVEVGLVEDDRAGRIFREGVLPGHIIINNEPPPVQEQQ